MLSSANPPLSASSQARLDALCQRWGDSRIYKAEFVKKKLEEIDQQTNPIAAAVKLRELYINLELAAMCIAELARGTFPEETTKVGPEYDAVQRNNRHAIKMKMAIAKMVDTSFYSVVFPIDKTSPDHRVGIFQKNIVTRFIDADGLAFEIINLHASQEKTEIFRLFTLFYTQSLEDIKFIQSELLTILKSQKDIKNKIERYRNEQTNKSAAELHLNEIISYLQDQHYIAYISIALSSLIRNVAKSIPKGGSDILHIELLQLIHLFKSCEIYALDIFHDTYKSRVGRDTFIFLNDEQVKFLRNHDKYMENLGKTKTEAQANALKHLLDQFVNHEKLATDNQILAEISNVDEFQYEMIRLERIVFDIFTMLHLVEYQIGRNEPPYELDTPTENSLMKSIGRKKTKPQVNTAEPPALSQSYTKIKPTKEYLTESLKLIDNDIAESQKMYRSIFRNSMLRRIAEREDTVLLMTLGNKITDVLLVKQAEISLALADAKSILEEIETGIQTLRYEISKLKKSLEGFLKNLHALADKENPDRILSKTELIQLELEKRAQEKKKREAEKLSEEKISKQVKAPYQRPTQEAKTVPAKLKPPASTPTGVKKPESNPFYPIRLLHLNEACKNLIFIRLILSLEKFDKDVKHYALLYNVFRCFQSLKSYQECGGIKNPITTYEVANLRNMIMHHGINAICEESVEAFSATIVGNLPQELSSLKKNDLFHKQLDDDSRQAVVKEFGLLERNSQPYTSFFNHAKLVIDNTPLYQKLKQFHETKTDNDCNFEASDIILEAYVPLMKNIVKRTCKVYSDERYKNESIFINSYLFELQALRMLAVICGELFNIRYCNVNQGFYDFLLFCHDHVRNVAAHELKDMDKPVIFFENLERHLYSFDEVEVLQQMQSASGSIAFANASLNAEIDCRKQQRKLT